MQTWDFQEKHPSDRRERQLAGYRSDWPTSRAVSLSSPALRMQSSRFNSVSRTLCTSLSLLASFIELFEESNWIHQNESTNVRSLIGRLHKKFLIESIAFVEQTPPTHCNVSAYFCLHIDNLIGQIFIASVRLDPSDDFRVLHHRLLIGSTTDANGIQTS